MLGPSAAEQVRAAGAELTAGAADSDEGLLGGLDGNAMLLPSAVKHAYVSASQQFHNRCMEAPAPCASDG
jgi:hypothetical protein